MNFDPALLDRIFLLLSAILRIGNITFQNVKADVVGLDGVEVGNGQDLEVLSSLLGISYQQLLQGLTTRTVSSLNRQSSVATPLSGDQARGLRDTMARTLYEKLFKFVLGKLNTTVNNGFIYPVGGYIGLLDIYGFEVFDVRDRLSFSEFRINLLNPIFFFFLLSFLLFSLQRNDFEQFSINFANEKLQTFFNDYIFRFEQADYLEEGIKWSRVDFIDNSDCLNLFTQKPLGLISLLDEESNLPVATPSTLVAKFNTHHGNPKAPTAAYVPVKTSATSFAINHFAAKVTYQSDDFLDKNRNSLANDVLAIFGSCENRLVQELFASV